MEIRKFKETDKESLITLWDISFPDDPPHNKATLILDAKLKVDDLVFVAENNGKIFAACMAGYDGHRGWLYAVAVHPEYRRNGLGSKIVHEAILALKELGCIKVNLQIRATNTEVASFYQSLGFQAEERLSMGAFIK